MLIPYWWHITPYSVAHYPLYCGTLHISYVGLGSNSGFIVVIVHQYLLYIGRTYCHVNHHIILSCIVHCVWRFLPWRGLIFISSIHILGRYYSFIVYFYSFYAIPGTWLHSIWYQISFLEIGFCKTRHIGTFSTNLFLQGTRDLG